MPHILFVVLDAGPADVPNTYRVRFFTLEPTLPARPAHHTHAVGHLHWPHRPIRLAHVLRLPMWHMMATSVFRWLMDIYPCSQPRAEGRHSMYMYHRCFSRMLVHVFARSVCLARGSKAHHGYRASSHDNNNSSAQHVLRDWKYPLWIVLTELAFQNNF